MTTAGKYIKVEIESATGICDVILNNVKQLNMMNDGFFAELGSTFDSLSSNQDVKVILLSSAHPKLFTAGLNLAEAASIFASDLESEGQDRKHFSICLFFVFCFFRFVYRFCFFFQNLRAI